MSFNMIIGMGNTGFQIVKAAADSDKLDNCVFYTIDSVTSSVDMKSVGKINMVSLISDDKAGSGRSRERGAAMFEFHDKNGTFAELYADAEKAKTPILIVTSAAGGTGSGSTPSLCKYFVDRGIPVIPIIIVPALNDPTAFHLNTNDLMMELGSIGVNTYCVFRNEYGKADYTQINQEVVTAIEIILGKHFAQTDKDSIDDSDLDVLLSTPGRFVVVEATAQTPAQLKRVITQCVLNGHQPFTSVDAGANTLMTAYALASPFASGDFEEVFSELNSRINKRFDEYRHICDRDGACCATVIIAGLPQAELKMITDEYQTATGISEGISKKSSRPSFMQKKGAVRSVSPAKKEFAKPAPVVVPEQTITNTDATEDLPAFKHFNVHDAGEVTQ